MIALLTGAHDGTDGAAARLDAAFELAVLVGGPSNIADPIGSGHRGHECGPARGSNRKPRARPGWSKGSTPVPQNRRWPAWFPTDRQPDPDGRGSVSGGCGRSIARY